MSNFKSVSMTSPTDVDSAAIAKRRAMAEALQAQSLEPIQPASYQGIQAPISWTQGLAKMLQAYNAKEGINKADADAKALLGEQQARRGADMSVMVRALQGTPASSETIVDEQANGGEGQTAQINAPAVSPMEGLQRAIPMMQDPQMQQVAFGQLMQQMQPKQPKFHVVGGNLVAEPTAPGQTVQPSFTAPDKDAGSWSEPYALDGATVQKNSKTGEIRTAVTRPPVTNVQSTVNAPPPSKVFDNEDKLRADYTTATKPFVGIRDAYNTVQAALSGPITATNTLAGATKFMKMIDPESVVRESELNMALKATGMLDRFMNIHNTILKGQVLTPKQAEEIKAIADTLYTTAEAQQNKTDEYFSGLAREYGLKPERVVRKQGSVMRKNDGQADPAIEDLIKKYAQ